MNKLFITHSDMDALGCNLVRLCFGQRFETVMSLNYHDYEKFDYNILKQFDEIWYADFSPDEKSLEIIKENNIHCKIFDHHESVYKDIINFEYNNIEYYYDNNRSGTKILFQYYLQFCVIDKQYLKILSRIVSIIDSYDLWKSHTKMFERESLNLNRIFWKSLTYYEDNFFIKTEYFLNSIMEKLNKDSFFFTNKEKRLIKEAKESETKKINSILGKGKFSKYAKPKKEFLVRTDNKGKKFAIFKTSSKVSYICYYFLENRTDLDYIIAINTYDKNYLKLSLRAKKESDVNLLDFKYAKGHSKSSGFDLGEKELQVFISNLWNGRIYQLEYLT